MTLYQEFRHKRVFCVDVRVHITLLIQISCTWSKHNIHLILCILEIKCIKIIKVSYNFKEHWWFFYRQTWLVSVHRSFNNLKNWSWNKKKWRRAISSTNYNTIELSLVLIKFFHCKQLRLQRHISGIYPPPPLLTVLPITIIKISKSIIRDKSVHISLSYDYINQIFGCQPNRKGITSRRNYPRGVHP